VAEQIGGAIAARLEASPSEGRIDFHLTLNPPELGQVRVQLTLTNQTLSARLVAQDGATRQLIQSQMDSLRQRLQDTGLGLGQLDVSGGGGGKGGQQYEPLLPFAGQTGEAVPQPAPSPRGAAGGTAAGIIDLVA
jgi:flagellar hook-length control protein FliK